MHGPTYIKKKVRLAYRYEINITVVFNNDPLINR